MDSFDHIWKLLNPASEYCTLGRIQACRALWSGYDLERQRFTYRAIRDKLQRGEKVSPVPYFAIQDNSRTEDVSPRQPTNYNGQWGMYTLTDIKMFGLQTKSGA